MLSQQQHPSPRRHSSMGQRWDTFRAAQQSKKDKNNSDTSNKPLAEGDGLSKSKPRRIRSARSRERSRRNSVVRIHQASTQPNIDYYDSDDVDEDEHFKPLSMSFLHMASPQPQAQKQAQRLRRQKSIRGLALSGHYENLKEPKQDNTEPKRDKGRSRSSKGNENSRSPSTPKRNKSTKSLGRKSQQRRNGNTSKSSESNGASEIKRNKSSE